MREMKRDFVYVGEYSGNQRGEDDGGGGEECVR